MPLQIAAQTLGAPDPQVSVDALLTGTHWKPSQGWVIVGDTLLSWERLLAQLPLLPPHAHSIVGLPTTVCLFTESHFHQRDLGKSGPAQVTSCLARTAEDRPLWDSLNLKQLPLTPGTCQPPQGVRISRYNRVEATLVLA